MKTFLAIRGDYVRGNEVIKILENLGGTNKNNLDGSVYRHFYFINLDGIIDSVFEERMLITQWETHTIDSYKMKYSKPNPNFIYKKKDIGKVLNEEFNEVYDAISDAYDKLNEFYMKHCAFCEDIENTPIYFDIVSLFDKLGNCKENAHEIVEYFTWDN